MYRSRFMMKSFREAHKAELRRESHSLQTTLLVWAAQTSLQSQLLLNAYGDRHLITVLVFLEVLQRSGV